MPQARSASPGVGALVATCAVALGAAADPISYTTAPLAFSGHANAVVAGRDGLIWVLDSSNNRVFSLTRDGVTLTPYPIPTANCGAYDMTLGPDGAYWFIEFNGKKIGRLTPAGVMTEFPLPSGLGPTRIVAGPDGNLWYAVETWYPNPNTSILLGRVTRDGEFATEFPLPDCDQLAGMTPGPDANLWVTCTNYTWGSSGPEGARRIGLDGTITPFAGAPKGSLTGDITVGPDFNLWFLRQGDHTVNRLTTDGALTSFPVPAGHGVDFPARIVTGGDGNLWFSDSADPTGKLAQLVLSTATDQGTATINEATGLDKPYTFILLPPPPARQAGLAQAVARGGLQVSALEDPPHCPPQVFLMVKSSGGAGGNLSTLSTGAGPFCADIQAVAAWNERKPVVDSGGAWVVRLTAYVTNGGPDPATGVTFEGDLLPGSIVVKKFQFPPVSDVSCTQTGTHFKCTIGGLNKGEGIAVDLSVGYPLPGGGQFGEFVGMQVHGRSALPDPNPGNNVGTWAVLTASDGSITHTYKSFSRFPPPLVSIPARGGK